MGQPAGRISQDTNENNRRSIRAIARVRSEEDQLKRFSSLSVIMAVVVLGAAAAATPVRLRCEYLENPLSIDVASPHLSWQSDSAERNWKQTAYELLVASSDQGLRAGQADVWDSGKVDSAESVGIVYRGPALESRKRYYWRVRVWDAGGQVLESTEGAWWETGLLHPSDWKAKWIRWKNPEDESDPGESAGLGAGSNTWRRYTKYRG